MPEIVLSTTIVEGIRYDVVVPAVDPRVLDEGLSRIELEPHVRVTRQEKADG